MAVGISLAYYIPFLSFLLVFTAVSIPVSTPPGPGDPWLLQVAPEKCLYYTCWSGSAPIPNESENSTERLLREPEIQQFVQALRKAAQTMIERTEIQAPGDVRATVEDVTLSLVTAVLNQPLMIYVVAEQPDPLALEAAFVMKLGAHEADVRAAIEVFERDVMRERAEATEISGDRFLRLPATESNPEITLGIHNGYLMIGVGTDCIPRLLERGNTPVPEWLLAAQRQVSVPRRATFTFADMRGAMELASAVLHDEDALRLIEALGAHSLGDYVSVSGLDEDGFVTRTKLNVDANASGVFRLLEAPALTPQDLADIPSNSTVAAVAGIQLSKLVEQIGEMADQNEPDSFDAFERGMTDAQSMLGIHLQEDFLATLGDRISLYTTFEEGGWLSGWTVRVPLTRPDHLAAANTRLTLTIRDLGDQFGGRLTGSMVNGTSIQTFEGMDSDFLVAPSWAVTDDELLVGLFPQAIRTHLTKPPQPVSLANDPRVAALLGRDNPPLALAYVDMRSVVKSFYPMLLVWARGIFAELNRGGFDLSVTMLPATSALVRELEPTLISVSRNTDGLLFESHQTAPGGSLGATAPMLIASSIPAIQSARLAAQRSQSINNVKQLVLSLINYESASGAFPGAYSTDAEGKPLLSWRVHILPFIEEDALYREFHLDEPWDSEHNRKLITRMPQVFQSPGSMADPGKTNYVAVRSERSILTAPAEDQFGAYPPKGMQVRNITDGTSKTLLIVESSDELAAIWTKPDDFEYDPENPANGLVGLRQNVFIAAFCDGSVRVIAETIQPSVLNALFTRDGGEVINDGDY